MMISTKPKPSPTSGARNGDGNLLLIVEGMGNDAGEILGQRIDLIIACFGGEKAQIDRCP